VSTAQRSLTGTIIAVVPPGTEGAAAETLASLSAVSGVQPVIISLGDNPAAPRTEHRGATVIEGLRSRYLDNAVASLRVSSLPAAVWWRTGGPQALEDLAALVDRIVLDLDDPAEAWARVPALASHAAVSDIRWARLTRWRDLLAQFFEVPEVRSTTYSRVDIRGADRHDAALLAGWLKSRLPGGPSFDVDHRSDAGPKLASIELSGPEARISVRLLPNGTCLETVVTVREGPPISRVVARGDDRLPALLGEELRVRSRDLAFEDAVRAAERL
jgi:hypothetical protein